MIVITSGSKYIDIDAYASCLAYRELLNLQGRSAVAVSTAKINGSVTPSLLALSAKFDNYKPQPDDEFVILDLSNPDYFDRVVDKAPVEVIDHHFGFESIWCNTRTRCQIEAVGAVATMIFEKYVEAGLENRISKSIAKLLAAAILDNTLNFRARITTARDREAYRYLTGIAGVNEDYAEKYFSECQKLTMENLPEALRNDTKTEHHEYTLPDVFSQLTVWDAEAILGEEKLIRKTLNELGADWLLNLIALENGKSYILVSGKNVQQEVERLFGQKAAREGLIVVQPAMLRKEIIKRALEEIVV